MKRRWTELVALMLLGGSTLLFEITLTKIFEFTLWANYAYLIISTAMFGLGLSGIILTRWPGLLRLNESYFLLASSLGVALSMLISLWLVNALPVHLPEAPFGWKRELVNTGLLFIGLSLPFVGFGLIMSFLFEQRGERANEYYFADLIGAGFGCLLMIPLISLLEPQGLIFLAGGLALAGGTLFAFNLKGRSSLVRPLILLAFLASGLLILVVSPRIARQIPLQIHVDKRNYLDEIKKGTIERSGWSLLSKVDVARSPEAYMKRIWIGGGINWSSIAKFDGDFEKLRAERDPWFRRAAETLNHHALPHLSKIDHSVCVIGTSGGMDSLLALRSGARRVVGIEMDPVIARFVTRDYRAFSGGLFTDGRYSQMVVDEGRSYLRRSPERFDVIQQVNNFTPIAFQKGALNLSETYLLTVESFEDFYDRLTDEGILSISRFGTVRLLSLAVEMFRRKGVRPEDYAQHLFVGEGNSWEINTFMMKRSPFSREEIDRLFLFYQKNKLGKRILYAPYRTAELPDPTHNCYYQIATAADPRAYWKLGNYDLSPTTDDRPFFNSFKRLGLSDRLDKKTASQVPAELRWAEPGNFIGGRVPPGDLPPFIVLAESLLLASLFFGLPLFTKKELRASLIRGRRVLGYFACLGIGFIFIEITLIQRLVLFLGAPVYSIAAVLSGLLVAAGLGSLCSGRLKPEIKNIRRLMVLVAAVVLGLQGIWPLLSRLFLGTDFYGPAPDFPAGHRPGRFFHGHGAADRHSLSKRAQSADDPLGLGHERLLYRNRFGLERHPGR